jgi:hypothetical protein
MSMAGFQKCVAREAGRRQTGAAAAEAQSGIRHPTSDIRHPASGIRHPTSDKTILLSFTSLTRSLRHGLFVLSKQLTCACGARRMQDTVRTKAFENAARRFRLGASRRCALRAECTRLKCNVRKGVPQAAEAQIFYPIKAQNGRFQI